MRIVVVGKRNAAGAVLRRSVVVPRAGGPVSESLAASALSQAPSTVLPTFARRSPPPGFAGSPYERRVHVAHAAAAAGRLRQERLQNQPSTSAVSSVVGALSLPLAVPSEVTPASFSRVSRLPPPITFRRSAEAVGGASSVCYAASSVGIGEISASVAQTAGGGGSVRKESARVALLASAALSSPLSFTRHPFRDVPSKLRCLNSRRPEPPEPNVSARVAGPLIRRGGGRALRARGKLVRVVRPVRPRILPSGACASSGSQQTFLDVPEAAAVLEISQSAVSPRDSPAKLHPVPSNSVQAEIAPSYAPPRSAAAVTFGQAAQSIENDRDTQQAMKEGPKTGSGVAGRAKAHALIRPPGSRTISAVTRVTYDRLLAVRLDLANVPTPEKLFRERIRRLLAKSVSIDTIFNPVSGDDEERLLDKDRRILVYHEEVDSILTYLWNAGYKLETNHTLRNKVAAQFAGIGPRKVEQFLAQMTSIAVKNFAVPHTHQPRHIVASRPMEHVQIDCTHLYSVTYLGSVVTGIISFIDIFSRYVFAWPIIAECSWEVCRAFIWFCSIFGAPEIVQTDHGSAFMGEMKAMAEQLYGARVIHGRVRHPPSQGNIEKSHGKLKKNIIGLTYEFFGDILRWPEMVPMGMRISNLALHSAFNEELSPFTVFFGRADNQPLAADVSILNGLFVQKTARLQALEEKRRARLAGQIDIDHYVAGNKHYDVELCFEAISTAKATAEELAFVAAGEDAQRLVDRVSVGVAENGEPSRVGYTRHGALLLEASGTVIRETLEYHRMCAESLLRQRLPGMPRGQELSEILRDVFLGDSTTRDCLNLFAKFSTGIREGAAQFIVAYLESVDAGTRKRMPAPFQQNDRVWVLSFGEESSLCRRYKFLWTSQTDRRLKRRLPVNWEMCLLDWSVYSRALYALLMRVVSHDLTKWKFLSMVKKLGPPDAARAKPYGSLARPSRHKRPSSKNFGNMASWNKSRAFASPRSPQRCIACVVPLQDANGLSASYIVPRALRAHVALIGMWPRKFSRWYLSELSKFIE